MKKITLYSIMSALFFVPLAVFVVVVMVFVPRKYGVMVIGLAGFVLLVAGPFWALRLEKYLRDRYMRPEKKKIDYEDIKKMFDPEE